jgi:hypothetical protein
VTSVVNRYYDPTTDQFLSIDPDMATTDQPYVFTNDDPLNAEDPMGLFCWSPSCLGNDLLANIYAAAAAFTIVGTVIITLPVDETGLGEEFDSAVIKGLTINGEDADIGITIDNKISGQMADRGWSEDDIQETVEHPEARHDVWDKTTQPPEPATAYVSKDGGYVVINDDTGNVVQISNRNAPNWKDVWNDPGYKR